MAIRRRLPWRERQNYEYERRNLLKPVAPIYISTVNRSTIILDQAPTLLRSGALCVTGTGEARLELFDSERVVIEFETNDHGYDLFNCQNLQMKFGQHGEFVPVVAIRSEFGSRGTRLWLLVSGAPFRQVRDQRVRLNFAIAHLLNFPEFFCLGAPNSDLVHANQLLGCIVLRDAVWEIEIQALPSTSGIVKTLKAEGGSAITHVARIERTDRKSFTCKQLESIVRDLRRFLSFARGAWTSVFGVVGFGRDVSQLYRDWSSTPSTPWQECQGWFDIHHGQHLAVAFPGFVQMLHEPGISGAANAALHWYLISNRGGRAAGVDGGLILSQAALERLCTSILAAADKFPLRKPGATAVIRSACQHLSLPTAIPAPCAKLVSWQRQGVFSDVPDAIVRLRNDIVHPERRLKFRMNEIIYDVWQLAQWYIEIILLRLSNYQGTYSRRFDANWIGQVREFP